MVVKTVADKLATGKISQLISSSQPDELSLITPQEAESKSDVLAKEISSIINKMRDPIYTSNTWIDNVQYRGITGSIDSSELGTLIPEAILGNKTELTIFVSKDSNLKRLKITGH